MMQLPKDLEAELWQDIEGIGGARKARSVTTVKWAAGGRKVTIQFEVLEAEALKLGTADRARLVEHLIASLDEDTEIEEAWAADVERRMEAIDTGSAQLMPVADVIAQARAALK
ncbi:addiction module protein [Azoarcus sp. KH32C]|uniref:addiction module protein n=1 Tax=Azoarcus sp. KH32C TaxID=748247 RepID=UPI00023867A4|nr:addiction module protein [Azoarcus sp. KH32C]BAL26402.1 hypothetical protein AZKH_4122 [Azoarcus sp. KH32C]